MNRPRCILLISYVMFAAILFTIPLESSDAKLVPTPLKVEVRSAVVTDNGEFTARVRFRNMTPRAVSLPEPQDTSHRCCPFPSPVMVFAAFPVKGRCFVFPGLVADTTGNHRLIDRSCSKLRVEPYSWIDMDIKTVGPLQLSYPLTFRCYYVNPREEGAGHKSDIERDGTFFGEVISDPLFVPARKVGP